MGMEFFSGEGLDLIFPLGGGAIFQPRGGLGGAKQQNFLCANVDIYKNIRINYNMRRQPQFFLLIWIKLDKMCLKNSCCIALA